MKRLLAKTAMILTAIAASPANANQTYFGSGLGKQCYDAVAIGHASHTDLKLCTKAIESGTLTMGNLPATYVNRGIILMRMERFNDAIKDYERALKMAPDLAEAKVNMGAALIGLRRYASAIAILEEGLKNDPLSPHVAYYNLGIVHEMIGDYKSARGHYTQALSLAPEWSPAKRKLDLMPPSSPKEGASR